MGEGGGGSGGSGGDDGGGDYGDDGGGVGGFFSYCINAREWRVTALRVVWSPKAQRPSDRTG